MSKGNRRLTKTQAAHLVRRFVPAIIKAQDSEDPRDAAYVGQMLNELHEGHGLRGVYMVVGIMTALAYAPEDHYDDDAHHPIELRVMTITEDGLTHIDAAELLPAPRLAMQFIAAILAKDPSSTSLFLSPFLAGDFDTAMTMVGIILNETALQIHERFGTAIPLSPVEGD